MGTTSQACKSLCTSELSVSKGASRVPFGTVRAAATSPSIAHERLVVLLREGNVRDGAAATACRPQAFQSTWCQLGFLLVVVCMLACRAGVRACDATRDVSSGGRGHGQEASIACTIIVADHGRVEGAATSTRRHGYR